MPHRTLAEEGQDEEACNIDIERIISSPYLSPIVTTRATTSNTPSERSGPHSPIGSRQRGPPRGLIADGLPRWPPETRPTRRRPSSPGNIPPPPPRSLTPHRGQLTPRPPRTATSRPSTPHPTTPSWPTRPTPTLTPATYPARPQHRHRPRRHRHRHSHRHRQHHSPYCTSEELHFSVHSHICTRTGEGEATEVCLLPTALISDRMLVSSTLYSTGKLSETVRSWLKVRLRY